MKRYASLFGYLLLFTGFTVCAQQKTLAPVKTQTLARPKLVVGIMVDQMRWDYLYRYYDRYQAGGFKRLLNEGFSCDNTQINYANTVTAAGHASVYTGTVPAIHGITGNDFVVQATGKSMYCTEDSTATTIGSTSKAGQMSPRNMLSTTITDELRLATNFRSKVIGIALKDRGAILPAGHSANAAYWFDDATGGWISSDYYFKDLPEWLKAFNAQNLPEKYMKQDWNTLYPIQTYKQSSVDNNAYEGKLKGTNSPTLPVKTSELFAKDKGLIRTTPYGNSITADLAKAAVINEQLGKGTETDFLAVSFSSTDYIGHTFGPNSIEIEDTFLRLDQDLANFFSFLDQQVGKGTYTVFLTADHGAAHNPVFMKDNHLPAGLWPKLGIQQGLNAELEKNFGEKNLAINLDNYQVSFNNKLISSKNLDEAAIRKVTVAFMQQQVGVAGVIDMKNMASGVQPEAIKSRLINSYHPDRAGVISVVLNPAWFSGYGLTGTTHGTWNPHDNHIPLVFMGWGVKPGKTSKPTYMTDIAATLATLLHIQMPNGSIGTPVQEVIK